MLKYLLLLYNREGPRPAPSSPEGQAFFSQYRALTGEMAKAGVLLDTAPLRESAVTSVRVRNGETILTDGPAAEIKEWLGGYTVIECEDLDQALEWAARIPAAAEAHVEVYPLVPIGLPS